MRGRTDYVLCCAAQSYVRVHAYSKAVLPSPGTPQLRVRALVDLYQVGAGSDPNTDQPDCAWNESRNETTLGFRYQDI